MAGTDIKIDLTPCIERALDAAAPDGESWRKGHTVFWDRLSKGTIGQALSKALDAAAPDAASWLAGEAAFAEGFTGRYKAGTKRSREDAGFRDHTKAAARKTLGSVREAFGPKRKH